jgi:lipoprotein signal peptidase
MLGNLGERVVHWGVTDYLSIRWGEYWLPPGNVADIALFLSMPLSIPVIAFELLGRARRRKAEADATRVGGGAVAQGAD